MEKMRMESENYVYKKEIDWSTLMEGFTLPLDNQVIFLRNMENILQKKKNVWLQRHAEYTIGEKQT